MSGIIADNVGRASGLIKTVSAGGTLTAAQDAASGSTVNFTGIPSGTKWIDVVFQNVSTDGVGRIYITIGDAGGLETSGYLGANAGILNTGSHSVNFSASFYLIDPTSAASGYSGVAQLRLHEASSFTWVCSMGGAGATNAAAECNYTGGHKPLSAELTQLQFGSSDSFDTTIGTGQVSIFYGT